MIYNIGIIWPILSPQTGLRVQLVFSEAKVVWFYITWGEGGSNIRDIAASRSSSQCYSLTGQAISQPKKGFYICNGRKYLVKER